MRVLESIRLWWRAFARRNDVERELEREMRLHLELEIENNIAGGMSPDEARRRALIAFGGVERHKESVRDERGTRWLDDLRSDAGLALRAFKSHPAFTATAVLTMAIGIGAATGVFGLANWILLRPVPGVSAPHELVSIGFYTEPNQPAGVSYPTLIDLQRATSDLVDLAGTQLMSAQFAAEGMPARELRSETVAGDYFHALGVRPQIGRFFQPDELSATSASLVAIISDRLWRDAFAAASTILGRTVKINGADFVVIGVAPRRFLGIERVGSTDLWLPPQSYRVSRHNPGYDVGRRDMTAFNYVVGRMRPAASASSVERQMRSEMARLATVYPDQAERYQVFLPHVTAGIGTAEYSRSYIERTLRLLSIVVGIVLLISCANAVSLLLFRGVQRRNEMAVRRALGASTARLVRLHATEGLLLGALGGVFGIGIAASLRLVLRNYALPGFPTIDELSIDQRVLVFAVVLSIATGVLFATLPALLALRADFLDRLRASARSDAGIGTARVRRGLVVLQIAASMTLVVTSVLFARTLRALYDVDLGIDVKHTTAFIADPTGQGYSVARATHFRDWLLQEIAGRPGIDAVTFASNAPFSTGMSFVDLRVAGYTGPGWQVQAQEFAVSPDYFATMGIPLLVGKTVPPENPGIISATGPSDVVISRLTARRLFGAENPIGKSIEQRAYRKILTHRVVGVVGDVRTHHVRGDLDLVMYSPMEPTVRMNFGVFIVKSSLRPSEVQTIIRDGVSKIDAAVPVTSSHPMTESVARAISTERLFAASVGTLAALTVLLMAIGLYSVIAYSVATRTHEIGVRRALGAPTMSVIRLFASQSIALVALGVALGTAASIAFSRLLTNWLFGVTSLSVSSYAVAASILLALGAVAAVGPARSATAVNPVDALRHE